MNVLIIQPPIVQLNTAYPSGAYLSAFFKREEFKDKIQNVHWLDLSIKLFYEIFSKQGLTKLFSLCTEKALKKAEIAEKNGDEATAFNLRRYICTQKLWIDWIDFITAILRADKSGFENAHRFVFGAHVPRGSRMENYLENLNHDLSTDDARSLASFALADLADFITAVFDENFSLVRYAEALTVSESTFSQIEKGINSPILKEFYLPILEKLNLDYDLVLISVPFAGTFASALATGRFFKQKTNAFVCLGGGFINTELRQTKEKSLSKYCNALSFDRGYAGYHQLISNCELVINNIEELKNKIKNEKLSIYKMRFFFEDFVTDVNENENLLISESQSEILKKLTISNYQLQITRSLVPDFSDIDFSVYPRLLDDKNPMHRLWSDGAWVKVYMAHGCYWHKCAFCDVTLDYVCSFCPTEIHSLYENLLKTAKEKGVFGIHFVDEAMPPAMMVAFAKENIAHGSPLTWWGNVRFEKYFTRDVADYLAFGGLIGVSAGLESATGNGLEAIHKGTDLQSIVGACCAFKEAGILVHAYMIYGYWWEKPQDLINSMETLRQFYANGLLDSCFWHKFVLTRHSRAFKEWQEGKIKDLKPIINENLPLFAKNGLHFEGEQKSEKYGRFLDYSLNQWMHGEDLEIPVQRFFDFQVPKPTVSQNFIEKIISEYEIKRNKEFEKIPNDDSKKIWLGGEKIKLKNGKIGWFYMGEYFETNENAKEKFFRGKGLCVLP